MKAAVAAAAPKVASAPRKAATSGLLLQRKCACGGSAGATGECEACRKERSVGMQTKLRVGRSDDAFELEADRVADRVMAMSAPRNSDDTHQRASGRLVQRRTANDASWGASQVSAAVDDVLGSSGTPLDASTRAFFEPRFGHDFSRIRIHADAAAARSADAVGALAYTVGHNVVFAANQYAPGSVSGNRVLAHELTHVVQQTGIGGAPSLQRKPAATAPLDVKAPFEGRILSIEDLRGDFERSAAFKFTGQTEAKVLDKTDPVKGKKLATLAPESRVKVLQVAVAPTVYTTSGAWVEGGAGWYEVEVLDQKVTGYVLGVFVTTKAKKKRKKPKKAETAAEPLFKIDWTIVQLPTQEQETIDLQAMAKKAFAQGAGGDLSRKNKALLEKYGDEKQIAAMLAGRQPPIALIIELPGDTQSAPKKLDALRNDNPLLITPWADIQFAPTLTLVPGDPKVIVYIDPNPQYTETYRAVENAPTVVKTLAPYFAPEIEPEALKAKDDATALRASRILKKLHSLSEEDRKTFDSSARGKMESWEQFDQTLTSFIERRRQIAQILKARPRSMTGSALEKMVAENRGTKPETTEIETKLGEIEAELSGRQQHVEEARKDTEPLIEHLRQNLGVALDPQQQLNIASAIFARGFIAGAQYEIKPTDWKTLNDELVGDPATFNAGILAGLVPGAIKGIWEAFAGLVELAVLAAKLGWGVASRQVKDIYEPLTDPGAFKKRKAEEQAMIESIIDGAKALAEAFKSDPAFLSVAAFDLGLAAGKGTGNWFSDDFMKRSVFDKGEFVGEVIGRIVIEVVMLVVAPEQIVARGAAGTGARVGPKVIKAVENLADSIPELKRLLQAKKVAAETRAAAKVVDVAEDVAPAAKKAAAATKEWAQEALQLSKKTLDGLGPDAIQKLHALPEKDLTRIRGLSEKAKRALMHCASPCNIDGPDIGKKLAKFTDDELELLADEGLLGKGVEVELTEKETERLRRVAEALKDDSKWGKLTHKDRLRLGRTYGKVMDRLVRAIAEGSGAKTYHYVDLDAAFIKKLRDTGGRVVITEGRIKSQGLRIDILEIDFSKKRGDLIDLAATTSSKHVAKTRSYKVALEKLLGLPVDATEMLYTGPKGELLETLIEVPVK